MTGSDASSWFDGAARLLDIPRFDDARGTLASFDFGQMPFLPARMFVISGVPVGTIRGRHALVDQQQILVCLGGMIGVEARWQGECKTISLARPDLGLFLDQGVWSSQHFSAEGSILLGLGSGEYDPNGYRTEVP